MTRWQTPILVLLIALYPALASARQAAPNRNDEPVVVTTGEAVVSVVPDRAWITLTAESRANTPRDAQRRNAEAMTPVLDKLKSAGVPADAIRTIGYDLQQEFDFVNNRRVSRGYVARNTVDVRVDVIDRVAELLEIAVASGATSVGGLRFDLKDRGSHEREAVRLATSDARLRADAAAAGAGRAVDRVVRIEEQRAGGPVPMPRLAMARETAQADAGAPAISAGQIEIRAQVTLTASLK